ncbi:MAG TPA: phosphate ABC transporter permease subunit PstC [Acidimicrobiia bacterium]|nr:phosphate ABC transporter permease subunit PstC [Acidimicrobiia bacterium]
MTALSPTAPAPPLDLSGDPRRLRRERRVRRALSFAGFSSLAVSIAIVASLLGKSFEFATNVDLGSLWTLEKWSPRIGQFDLATLFMGSLLVTAIAMLIATPLGLGAAIYLAEYARPRARRILKPILEVLAGIPSIVIGFFAVAWIGPEIVQRVLTSADVFSLAAAGVGVGILVTPLVASVSEDAMRAVPYALREASYGMGARKISTIVRVIIPASISGIVAALILAMSRAIGETMVVALAAGAFGEARFTSNASDVGMTVTAAMASLAAGTDQVAGGGGAGAGQAYNSLFFLGLLLFIVTLGLNLIGNSFVKRVREQY